VLPPPRVCVYLNDPLAAVVETIVLTKSCPPNTRLPISDPLQAVLTPRDKPFSKADDIKTLQALFLVLGAPSAL